MNYLIVTDSDGTLRYSDGSISPRTKKIIEKLLIKGNIVTICTARPRYHTLKISEQVGINGFLISSNGAEVYDNLNNKIIYSAYLSPKYCKKIYLDVENIGIRAIFVCDNIEYATQFIRNDSQILLNENNIDNMLAKNIKQIMIIGKNKEKIKKYKSIVEKYNLNIIDTSNDAKEEIWFSIISNKASKGITLKKLAEYLSIPMCKTVAIGNDNNDLSMIQVARVGVAVENATDELKKKANYITDSNDDDGVAKYLEKLT